MIDTLRPIARRKRLTARLRALFLILDRNREWWAKGARPAPGARVRFGASRVIFQYYPGKGLQLQPLANFGLRTASGMGAGTPTCARCSTSSSRCA